MAGAPVTRSTAEDASREIESRAVWLFGSPRSGSTWVCKLAAHHRSIEVMEEPTIGYHLSPFLSNEPGYHAADLDLDTFTLRRVAEDNPQRFFAAKHADVWVPGLRRLLNERLLAHMEREAPTAAADAAAAGQGAEWVAVGGRDHARPT